MDNPWLQLPAEPPFVLPLDVPYIPNVPADDPGRLQLSVPPHPFAGCPLRSRVLLLFLNPGFDGSDVIHYEQDSTYRSMLFKTFDFSNEPPLWCLDSRVSHTGAFKWLHSRTRRLSEECGLGALQQHLMQIQYLAYKSRKYKHLGRPLPSQRYSFGLVNQAMDEGKVIVVMRSRKLWEEAVPGLSEYPYLQVRNPRSPYLTPNNLPPGGFERLCKALSA